MTSIETALREALENIAVESEGYAKRISDRWVNTSFWSIAKKARAALSLPAQDGWLPIESAPSNVAVLVGLWLSPRRWFQIVAEKVPAEADNWIADSGQITLAPTHWRPLPPPPLPTGQKEA